MILTELISQIQISCDCLDYNREIIAAFTVSLRSSYIMDAITENPQYNLINIAFKKFNMMPQDKNDNNIRCILSLQTKNSASYRLHSQKKKAPKKKFHLWTPGWNWGIKSRYRSYRWQCFRVHNSGHIRKSKSSYGYFFTQKRKKKRRP